MLKTSIIFFLIAIGAGAAVGGSIAYRRYVVPSNVMGPFSSVQPMTTSEIGEFLATLEPEGLGRVEVVGGNKFDFGVMRRNEEATHQFVVKNVGTGTLDLSVTGSTCKCTVGSLKKASLEPGETRLWICDGPRKQTSAPLVNRRP